MCVCVAGGRFKKEIVVDGQSYLLLIRDEGGPPEAQVSTAPALGTRVCLWLLLEALSLQVCTEELKERPLEMFPVTEVSQFSSVAQSCPTLRPHGPQHPRPPCPSPTPGIYSDSRPLSW